MLLLISSCCLNLLKRILIIFLTLFERGADSRAWPDADRTLTLRCVLTGRAQKAYSSLSISDSDDYLKIKTAVLHGFELVPEVYQ
jgi:hypothetical protein